MDNKLPFDIDNYHRVFKKYPKSLMQSGDRVYGVWIIGNFYRRKVGYHGEYPPSFLDRIYALFPNKERVLHLFSGTIEDGKRSTTVDINPSLNPTVVCDVLEMSNYLKPNYYELVIADPPYSKKDAKVYGVPLINKRLALREARKVTEEGGILIWLDLQTPIYRKIDWQLLGMIGISCGTNRVFRVATIFQASKEEELNENCKASDVGYTENQGRNARDVKPRKRTKKTHNTLESRKRPDNQPDGQLSRSHRLSRTIKKKELSQQITV